MHLKLIIVLSTLENHFYSKSYLPLNLYRRDIYNFLCFVFDLCTYFLDSVTNKFHAVASSEHSMDNDHGMITFNAIIEKR